MASFACASEATLLFGRIGCSQRCGLLSAPRLVPIKALALSHSALCTRSIRALSALLQLHSASVVRFFGSSPVGRAVLSNPIERERENAMRASLRLSLVCSLGGVCAAASFVLGYYLAATANIDKGASASSVSPASTSHASLFSGLVRLPSDRPCRPPFTHVHAGPALDSVGPYRTHLKRR